MVIATLREAKISTTKYKVGNVFPLPPKFIEQIENCLVSFACYLYYHLMAKLFPTTVDKIDENLNSIIYNSLVQNDYNKAISIIDSITSHSEKHSSYCHFMFTINKAIALKFSQKNDQALKLLQNQDWTSCNDQFLMAKAVLEDNFQTASKYMKNLDLEKMEYPYIEWPLFEKFRESAEFQKEYMNLYGISFTDRLRNISDEKAKELAAMELRKEKLAFEQAENEAEFPQSLPLQETKAAS